MEAKQDANCELAGRNTVGGDTDDFVFLPDKNRKAFRAVVLKYLGDRYFQGLFRLGHNGSEMGSRFHSPDSI